MKRARAQVLLLAIFALVLAGCGSTSEEDSTGTTGADTVASGQQSAPASRQEPGVVSEKQISGTEPGTAERTVLDWWRQVQLNDPEQALDLYLQPPALPDLAGQFNLVSPHLRGSVGVLTVEEGDPAVARVRWKQPNGDVRVVTLRLEQDGGGAWKLVDSRFLDEMVVELQAAGSNG